jgi:hypothetical protein
MGFHFACGAANLKISNSGQKRKFLRFPHFCCIILNDKRMKKKTDMNPALNFKKLFALTAKESQRRSKWSGLNQP